MMNRLKAISQKHFVEATLEFLETWKEKFPDCASTSDALIHFTETVVGDAKRESEEILKWDTQMSRQINQKQAKYAKAVERILGEPATCYLACEYKDIDALFGSSSQECLFPKRMNIHEKYKSDTFSIEDRTLFWKFIQSLNQNALAFLNKEAQRAPSREEIQENIRKHKQAKEIQAGPPSMVKAFHSSFIAFADVLCDLNLDSSSDFRKHVTKADPDDLLSNWSQMLTANNELSAKCKEVDIEWLVSIANWAAIPVEYRALVTTALSTEEKSQQLCGILDQMNSFCSVRKHIPNGMMGQIENYALKLAEDINSGKCDLNSINLQQIGQDVLQNCDSGEMMQMADNIGHLLPTLQSLQKGMG